MATLITWGIIIGCIVLLCLAAIIVTSWIVSKIDAD